MHRGGRGQSFVYELLYDGGGNDGRPHLMGLVDPATLTPTGDDYDANVGGPTVSIEGPSSPHRAPTRGRSSDERNGPPTCTNIGGTGVGVERARSCRLGHRGT